MFYVVTQMYSLLADSNVSIRERRVKHSTSARYRTATVLTNIPYLPTYRTLWYLIYKSALGAWVIIILSCICISSSFAYPHHLDADPDPAYHSMRIRFRTLHLTLMRIRIRILPFNDTYPCPSFQIKSQNLEKVLK
jgi:hypothetical protein